MLMLMFRSVSKNTFLENRLNDGGLNFMNTLNNITKKNCRCSEADSFTFLIPSRHATSFQRLYDVYTMSVTSYRHRIDIEMTSCIYCVTVETGMHMI